MRIGHGFDVHAFGPGSEVVLGGVRVPCNAGLVAHSDGDVVIHALCDALLGAVALGDIGKHFPDTDADYAGADSRELLRHVLALAAGEGFEPANVDITVIAQKPKLAPYIYDMKHLLAMDLGLPANAVNVKATTTERLGYVGREEGIAAHSVVLLVAKTS
jgi:2-C-methyl-D-erythritol 2,4-cyclodiphosphate synthase